MAFLNPPSLNNDTMNSHNGRGGFETRPYRQTLAGIFAIYALIP